jgi:hypothetical protein
VFRQKQSSNPVLPILSCFCSVISTCKFGLILTATCVTFTQNATSHWVQHKHRNLYFEEHRNFWDDDSRSAAHEIDTLQKSRLITSFTGFSSSESNSKPHVLHYKIRFNIILSSTCTCRQQNEFLVFPTNLTPVLYVIMLTVSGEEYTSRRYPLCNLTQASVPFTLLLGPPGRYSPRLTILLFSRRETASFALITTKL